MTLLHVFALNSDTDVRHTHLTRARGEAALLPPLASWLGVESVETDEIELFPVSDLDQMPLSTYVTTAFAPEQEIASDVRARMDALDGPVLLVPETAMDAPPSPRAEVTLVATVPLARPDHAAILPKSDLAPTATPAEEKPDRPREKRSGAAVYVIIVIASLIALYLVLGM